MAEVGNTRLDIRKTYKLYIGGKFPRTESGRYDQMRLSDGRVVNLCRASRKDFRNAVVAAANAQPAWQSRTAYNRSQILYRLAEMLEGRRAQFIEEGEWSGNTIEQAQIEVDRSIDLLVYYAGWADKYQQIFSSVNPVAASYFNFSVLEPMGVIAALAPQKSGLLGLLSVTIPAIVGGNTVVVLAGRANPLSAISFAEVVQTSDVPAGVYNILTGRQVELQEHFASHMDVKALVLCQESKKSLVVVEGLAAENVKRVVHYAHDIEAYRREGPYPVTACQEVKTTWHPIGK